MAIFAFFLMKQADRNIEVECEDPFRHHPCILSLLPVWQVKLVVYEVWCGDPMSLSPLRKSVLHSTVKME